MDDLIKWDRTVVEKKVFDFLAEYKEEHGRFPTQKEIQNHLGHKSASHTLKCLQRLEDKNWIKRLYNCERAIHIL